MPLPTDTLLRVQDSPVPTHTLSGLDRSMATAPIDCTGSRSKTGLKVVPPFNDFHTPPLAEPTKNVMRPSLSIASTAEMRPLMVAEPILRMGKPETVAASNFTVSCAEAHVNSSPSIPPKRSIDFNGSIIRQEAFIACILIEVVCLWTNRAHFFGAFFRDAGTAKSPLSIGMLTSILSIVVLAQELGSFFGPELDENGNITPFTALYEPISMAVSRTAPRTNSCRSSRISK